MQGILQKNHGVKKLALDFFKEECLTDESFVWVIQEIQKLKELQELELFLAIGDSKNSSNPNIINTNNNNNNNNNKIVSAKLSDISTLKNLLSSNPKLENLKLLILGAREGQISFIEDVLVKESNNLKKMTFAFKAHKSIKARRREAFESTYKNTKNNKEVNTLWHFFTSDKIHNSLKIKDLNTIVQADKQYQGRFALQNWELDFYTDFSFKFKIHSLSPDCNFLLGVVRKKYAEKEYYYTAIENTNNGGLIDNFKGVYQIAKTTYQITQGLNDLYLKDEEELKRKKQEKEEA